jgi:hypothetical protein
MDILSFTHFIESDCDLPLFVHDIAEDVPKVLKQGIGYINHMIDLEYMTLSAAGFSFTESGLNYMSNKHPDYLHELACIDLDKLPLPNFLPLIHQAKSRSFTDPLMGTPLNIPIFNDSHEISQLNNKIGVTSFNEIDWNEQLPDQHIQYGRKDPDPIQ